MRQCECLEHDAGQVAVLDAARLGVLTRGNSQSPMLTRKLDRQAEQQPTHGQQDQWPELADVESEMAWLLKELDTQVVDREKCRRDETEHGAKQHGIHHEQQKTDLQFRLRFAARRGRHSRLRVGRTLDGLLGLRDCAIVGLV